MSDMDDYIHISIHRSELKLLDRKICKFIEEYRVLEMYRDGKKKGKKFDKTKEFKRLIAAMLKARANNNGKESNEECHYLAQMIELLQKMMLYEFRKLEIEKLLA